MEIPTVGSAGATNEADLDSAISFRPTNGQMQAPSTTSRKGSTSESWGEYSRNADKEMMRGAGAMNNALSPDSAHGIYNAFGGSNASGVSNNSGGINNSGDFTNHGGTFFSGGTNNIGRYGLSFHGCASLQLNKIVA